MKRQSLYWVASITLAAILLFYSLRGIEWRQVWVTLSSARIIFLILALTMMTAALFIRSCRWRVILSAEGKVSVPLAFWATAAGYLGNNILPARAGEVVRSLIISRRTGMSKAFVLTTALSERVADAIAVIAISSIVLFTMRNLPGWLSRASKPFAIIGLCGVATISLIPTFEVFWFRLLGVMPVPVKLRTQAESVIRNAIGGIRSLHDYRRLLPFILLTGIIWCSDAAITMVFATSINAQITLPVAFLLIAGLALGSALPSTPGYVGIYQFIAVSILTPFGMSRSAAIAYILMFQAMNYVLLLLWGGIGFAQQRRPASAVAL